MSEAGTTPVTARLAFGAKKQLADMRPLFKAERARARALSATLPWGWDGLPGREAAAKRDQWAMYRAHLREAGELAGATLSPLAGEVDLVDFLIVTFLRTSEPGVYRMLGRHRDELTGTSIDPALRHDSRPGERAER